MNNKDKTEIVGIFKDRFLYELYYDSELNCKYSAKDVKTGIYLEGISERNIEHTLDRLKNKLEMIIRYVN